DDARQHGEHPQGGKSEDDERQREARFLHRAAEQRVLGHAALHAHRRGECERPGCARRQRRLHLDLARKLGALDACDGCRPLQAHDANSQSGSSGVPVGAAAASRRASSDVSSRKSDSSERARRSSDRTATPARPSAMTYASSASMSAETSNPPPAAGATPTRGQRVAIARAARSSFVRLACPGAGGGLRSSSIVPEKTTSPPWRIVTRSHSSSTSAIPWLLRTTAAPSLAIRHTSARTSAEPAGSSELVGSSSRSNEGDRRSAAARPRRCRMPAEYPAPASCACAARPGPPRGASTDPPG